MTEQIETIINIDTDSQMEEKRKKLHPRPESEEKENPLDSKKRRKTSKENEIQTEENTSTHEENEEHKDDEATGVVSEVYSVKKEALQASKSAKKTRSKSRSNIKSKSKSKSKSRSKARLNLDSVKKSASKVKEAFLSESSYSFRPRKNIDYTEMLDEQKDLNDKLVSETGKTAEALDKDDVSDMSFKADSVQSDKVSAKVGPKQEETTNHPTAEETLNRAEDALLAPDENKPVEVPAENQPEPEAVNEEEILDETTSSLDPVKEVESAAATREEILEELKELEGNNIILTLKDEDILSEKEKYQEFRDTEETAMMKIDSEKIDQEKTD